MSKQINVALIGNPNTGKTSVFNQLTGLNQKVGNYPGITVEKKEGICKLPRGVKAHIIDLPGTYSLNTTSLDESVAVELLLNKKDKNHPDLAIVVSDVENLKRNLLLFTQIKDLKIPTILVINMADQMIKKGIVIDIDLLEKKLNTKIALISSRKGTGIDALKELITGYKKIVAKPCIDTTKIDTDYFKRLQQTFPKEDLYKLWLVITQDVNFMPIEKKLITDPSSFATKSSSELKRLQQKETILRYKYINEILKEAYYVDTNAATGGTAILDKILTHKVFGYLIFFSILLLIFQAIYDWTGIPMDFIDECISAASEWTKNTLPEGAFTNLIAEGILTGIGGIVIFIPQIAFLFLFLALLEETGYMSRVVFLTDRIMRPFGLSGKSIVPLISGTACAIPAVMATRTIENWKERLITILVTPFTTCSARLPVYLIIISLVIPEGSFLGISYQALTLMLLYLLGFGTAILAAIIWFLGSNGISDNFKNADTIIENKIKTEGFSHFNTTKIQTNITAYEKLLNDRISSKAYSMSAKDLQDSLATKTASLFAVAKKQEIASYKLENSYMGYLGKAITPIVEPLGYDWKIGIAVLTSFAAREVFVGTLATIYSVGNDEEDTITNRMAAEINPKTNQPLFNLASGISLLLFYAFAMQCMSTLAIVKRETNTWKWPAGQLVFMTIFAYIIALTAYQILQ